MSQKSFIALFVLLAIFLIPILSSSLRGLTHIITCEEPTQTPFVIETMEAGPPRVTSSTKIERDGAGGLCAGLNVNLGVRGLESQKLEMIVSITNQTEGEWRGTVALEIEGGAKVPVDIGRIPPNQTRTERIQLALERGSHNLDGRLLIGP